MFSILYYRSAGIYVSSIIVFGIAEFTFLAKSIPTNEACVNVSGEEICYFKGSETDAKWEEAKRLCSSLISTLPVIRNQNEQDALAGYLRSHNITNLGAWSSGRNFILREWTWINGQQLKDAYKVKLQEKHEEEQKQLYASVDSTFSFHAQGAFQENRYICQYRGVLCNVSSDLDLAVDCFNLSDDNRTWYEARNQCLKTGGDLAVISDNVSAMLWPLELQYSYWIGLRKELWQWMRNDEPNDEIKYTNWDNSFATEGECISIDASTGNWNAFGCNEVKAAVCQRVCTTPTTTPKKTPDQESSAECACGTMSYTTFTSVGVCLIVISNVIVAVLVRMYMKSHSSSNSSGTGTHQNVGYQNFQPTQRQLNPNDDPNYSNLQPQPEYEEIGRDNRSH